MSSPAQRPKASPNFGGVDFLNCEVKGRPDWSTKPDTCYRLPGPPSLGGSVSPRSVPIGGSGVAESPVLPKGLYEDGPNRRCGEQGEGDDELPDEDVETAWAAAAEVEYERLTALLAPLRVGIVHGRLKPVDRDAEMARFRDGDLDVLVGTTVVEVGVDVTAATMMVVEGADRFGLAQLHQLRGRVGRGTVASFCVLVSAAAEGTTEHERLKAVASTTDGFALAERDFELRREGDVLGLAQSGLPRLRVATLANPDHRELATRARTYAEALVGEDGELADGGPPLAHELAAGWLRNVFAGDPRPARPRGAGGRTGPMADAGRVIADGQGRPA